MRIVAEISVGELVDKTTILEIKRERIADRAKLSNIAREYVSLTRTLAQYVAPAAELEDLRAALKSVNAQLWVVEDDLRACERARRFDDAFVQLARSVYKLNDRRAELKRRLNVLAGSAIVEEKSYEAY